MARRRGQWWRGEKSTSVVARWERVYQAEEACSKSSREESDRCSGPRCPNCNDSGVS